MPEPFVPQRDALVVGAVIVAVPPVPLTAGPSSVTASRRGSNAAP
jgi:hypothetical protein